MRTLYRISLVSLALAIVVGLTAAAQTTAPTAQSQASSPAQTSTTPPEPQASREGPNSNPAPQSQASPQANSPAQNRAQGQEKSIDDELQLTPDQKQKISAVVEDENKQITAVRDDASLTTNQKIEKARAIRQAGAPKIKAILTPEQLQKLAAIQERARQQHQENKPTPQQKPPQ